MTTPQLRGVASGLQAGNEVVAVIPKSLEGPHNAFDTTIFQPPPLFLSAQAVCFGQHGGEIMWRAALSPEPESGSSGVER